MLSATECGNMKAAAFPSRKERRPIIIDTQHHERRLDQVSTAFIVFAAIYPDTTSLLQHLHYLEQPRA